MGIATGIRTHAARNNEFHSWKIPRIITGKRQVADSRPVAVSISQLHWFAKWSTGRKMLRTLSARELRARHLSQVGRDGKGRARDLALATRPWRLGPGDSALATWPWREDLTFVKVDRWPSLAAPVSVALSSRG